MHNAEIYNELLKNGITDIWIPEMEFLPPDRMEQRKQLWADTFRMDDLTVFAVNGYGDFFAWRTDDSVVFIEIGSGTCTEFAGSLTDAVFRRIMEFANGDYNELCTDAEKAELDEDDAEDCISESEAITFFRQYLTAFGAYFTTEQNTYIENLMQQGFLPDCVAFICEEEFMRILRDELHMNTAKTANLPRL